MVIDGQRQVGHRFIVEAIHRVTHETILQITVKSQFLMRFIYHPPISLDVGIGIYLIGTIAVVFIVYRKRRVGWYSQIFQYSPMVTEIIVSSGTYLQIHRFRDILAGNHETGKVILQPFLVHAVTLGGRISHNSCIQTPITVFLLFVLLIITASVCIMEGGSQTQTGCKSVVDGQLRMLLGIIVRLVGIIDG